MPQKHMGSVLYSLRGYGKIFNDCGQIMDFDQEYNTRVVVVK